VLTLQTERSTRCGDFRRYRLRICSHRRQDQTAISSLKLIDVYPEDYVLIQRWAVIVLMIANDVLRGRFRKSFEKPVAITPNHIDEYTIDLHHKRTCLFERPQNHGSGTEHLVSRD